jgi:AcrR family transcriptional regulator
VPRPRTVSDDAVLDATAVQIGRAGPAQLTLAHVAGECGLAPATLIQRFGSKRGLLLALARRPLDLAALLPDDPSALAGLRAGLARLAAPAATPETLANNLAFLQLDLADEEFRAAAVGHFAALEERIAALLEVAIARGELAAGADPARLAESLVTTYNGALITWAVRRDGALADWLARQVDALLVPYATRRPVSSVE